MALRADQFAKHLRGDTPAPVYLVAGNEPLLQLEAVDALRRRAREWGFGEREVFDVEAGFDWDRLVGAFSALSLFSQRRLLELRLPGGRPGKEGAQVISDYCRAPPPDTLLLLSAGAWSRQHEGAWSRAVEKAGIVHVSWPVRPEELPAWISARLASRGLAAEPAAVQLLADRIEGNLLAAAQEVDKLALLLDDRERGQRITEARMQALVADSARYDLFGMADAALAGDAVRARRMLAGLRAEGEQVAGLLPALVGPLQTLATLAAVQARGGNLAQAMEAARVWQAKQRLFRGALARGDVQHWTAMLAWLARVDRMSKGREAGDAFRELDRLLTAVAAPRARVLLHG